MSGSYERALIKDSFAFYGIEKACRGVEICHLECRDNGRFLWLSKILNAISEKSLKA